MPACVVVIAHGWAYESVGGNREYIGLDGEMKAFGQCGRYSAAVTNAERRTKIGIGFLIGMRHMNRCHLRFFSGADGTAVRTGPAGAEHDPYT